MAYDDLETDHHLTPSGWIDGDSRYMGKTDISRPIPTDRVLTLTHVTYQRSAYSQEERSVKVAWRGDVSNEYLRKLRQKYPPPFPAEDE